MPSIINSTTTNGVAISPDNSGSLQLATNNGTTAVTIDTSQNVGIGTTSPSSKLVVQQSNNTGDAFRVFANGTDTQLITRYLSSSDVWQISASYASTGAYKPISFFTSDVERMRIDSSGNVGIGNTTPSSFNSAADNLVVGTNSGNNGITIVGGTTGFSSIYLADGTSGSEPYRGYIEYRHSDDAMAFGTSGSERMRIDSSGNLLVGTSSFAVGTNGISIGANSNSRILMNNNTDYGIEMYGSTTSRISFHSSNGGGTRVGAITVNTTNTTYGTSSDYRLKENIAPMTGALAKVQALKPVTYTWKADGSEGQGFIAHELQEVIPDAVVGDKDAVEEDGSIKSQQIDTSFLVATLTAAIQELKAELDATKAEVQALKGVA